jgi:hypothetical protein
MPQQPVAHQHETQCVHTEQCACVRIRCAQVRCDSGHNSLHLCNAYKSQHTPPTCTHTCTYTHTPLASLAWHPTPRTVHSSYAAARAVGVRDAEATARAMRAAREDACVIGVCVSAVTHTHAYTRVRTSTYTHRLSDSIGLSISAASPSASLGMRTVDVSRITVTRPALASACASTQTHEPARANAGHVRRASASSMTGVTGAVVLLVRTYTHMK